MAGASTVPEDWGQTGSRVSPSSAVAHWRTFPSQKTELRFSVRV